MMQSLRQSQRRMDVQVQRPKHRRPQRPRSHHRKTRRQRTAQQLFEPSWRPQKQNRAAEEPMPKLRPPSRPDQHPPQMYRRQRLLMKSSPRPPVRAGRYRPLCLLRLKSRHLAQPRRKHRLVLLADQAWVHLPRRSRCRWRTNVRLKMPAVSRPCQSHYPLPPH